jgi:hypothetical protein
MTQLLAASPRRSVASSLVLLASGFWLLASSQANAADEPIPPQVQSAVDRGLEYLARIQDPSSGEFPAGRGRPSRAAVSSLAVMAFMARGHVPGQGPYGDNINKGIDYVLSLQKPDGTIASRNDNVTMYDHGISTVMLCEVYGMLDERRQRAAHDAIAKAVRLILRAQAVPKNQDHKGGWRYQPTSPDSDISVSGWQLMALRGAANIGANIPEKAISDGIAYIKRCHDQSGGFMYANHHVNPALTGTGIVALELLGQHNSKEALAGGDYLLANGIGRKYGIDAYFYTVYYCSQAAWQLGGRYWEALTPTIRQSLLAKQQADGSWHAETIEQQGGEAYGTSMAILALTVPYRYLPIYQR